ncbi:MAG: sulfotransferase [Pseudomonadota bacterium]
MLFLLHKCNWNRSAWKNREKCYPLRRFTGKLFLDNKNSRSQGKGMSTIMPNSSEILGLRKVLIQAESLRRAGKLVEAEKLCLKLLKQNPIYMGALQTYGLVSIERENYPQAVTCFLTACAEAPNDPTNYLNLAAAWVGLEKSPMAKLMLEKALELDPDNAEIHHLIGDVHVRNREYDLAMNSFAKAIDLDSGQILPMFKLADSYVNLGYFDEAKDILFKLNKMRPDWIGVINLLHHLPKDMVDLNFFAALKKAKQQKTETSAEFENSRDFLEASVLCRDGEHGKAWPILMKANEQIYSENKHNFEKANSLRVQELAKAKLEKIPSKSKTYRSVVPLFIMGASRSGKTTLEVLLGTHPDIKRGYENHNVQESTIRASQVSGLINIDQLWRLPEPVFAEFSKDFRNRIEAQADGHKILTNTSPGLIGSAAQIAKALPEARFIFISRNADDLALRILMKKYKRANYHSYNLDTTRDYIRWYNEMMTILSEKLGSRVLTTTYEDIVTNPGRIAAKVIDFCLLPKLEAKLPAVGSDIGCAEPYAHLM